MRHYIFDVSVGDILKLKIKLFTKYSIQNLKILFTISPLAFSQKGLMKFDSFRIKTKLWEKRINKYKLLGFLFCKVEFANFEIFL